MNRLGCELDYLNRHILPPLLSHVGGLFARRSMPAHNEQHHQRVWRHCQSLLQALSNAGHDIAPQLARNALIACMFHDTGLLVDIGESHGKHSAAICADYLKGHNVVDASEHAAILEAIAQHDNKQLRCQTTATTTNMLSLNVLVATADDLDAAGLVGAVRYIEIYSQRGIAANDIAPRARQNVAQRRNNWSNAYRPLRDLVALHSARFAITEQFFEQLPQHPELLPWIMDNLVGAQNIDLQQLAKTEPSEPVGNFLNKLLVELNHSAQ